MSNIGDKIIVVFKNLASRPYSIHAHGVKTDSSVVAVTNPGTKASLRWTSIVPVRFASFRFRIAEKTLVLFRWLFLPQVLKFLMLIMTNISTIKTALLTIAVYPSPWQLGRFLAQCGCTGHQHKQIWLHRESIAYAVTSEVPLWSLQKIQLFLLSMVNGTVQPHTKNVAKRSQGCAEGKYQ